MAEDAKKAPFLDRVAAQAVSVRPSKALLTVLMLPFYVLGFVLGVAWVALRFVYGAVKVGILDASVRLSVGKGGG